MVIKTFKELVVWQKSHELVIETYKLIKIFPKSEEFALSNQMRRAAVSIPSNIAEGFKRKGTKDSVHFYNIAEGSLEELKYQLLLSRDLSYISNDQYNKLESLSSLVGASLNNWKKSQQ